MIVIPYPANIYTKEALRSAIAKLEKTVENCGALTHKEAKQSDSAKAYFTKQEAEARDAIAQLHDIIKEIT